MGQTKTVMKLYAFTLTIGIPLAFLLIPIWGINGMIISSFLAAIPSLFISLYLVWKKYEAKVDLTASARIVAASTLAAACVYLFLEMFSASQWLRLVLGLAIYLTVFFVSAPLIGAVNPADINNLRVMFSNSGIISKVMEIPLRIMEQVQKQLHQRKDPLNPAIIE
jgi:peptidoglycan biosynthesis protein MviN/MurJ (putative lipid II flippase)